MSIVRNLIAGYARRRRRGFTRVVNERGVMEIRRWELLRQDEYYLSDGRLINKLPWWCPFNVFLHHWTPPREPETMHDHPRWSVTLCLANSITESSPWSTRVLEPGDIVVRSRRAIHSFAAAPSGKRRNSAWTIFIVGRRRYEQHWYDVRKMRR